MNWVLWGNSVAQWLTALGLWVGVSAGLFLLRWLLARRETSLAFVNVLAQRTRGYFILAVGAYAASLWLHLSAPWHEGLRVGVVLAALLQVGLWFSGWIQMWIQRRIREQAEKDAAQATNLNALGVLLKAGVWVVVVVLMLDNLPNVEITTLIASLGITGIAVGLAVQNILSDLFSSLSITLDKPFVIGDVITVGEFTGTVEHIGLKSTRLRGLPGEEVIFSNSDLLNSRIRNFQKMERRRVGFEVVVAYTTPQAVLQRIPELLRECVLGRDQVVFGRAHLKALGDFGAVFECVYFVESPEYDFFMDTQQAVLLAIYQRFEAEGITLAQRIRP